MSESGTAERDTVALVPDPARSPFADAVPDPEIDARLLEAARGGDAESFAELWSLHREAAYAAARSSAHGNADDVVSEAYATIWAQLQRGSGPHEVFREHLLDTVRGISARWFRAGRTVVSVPEVEDVPDPSLGEAMESVEERAMILQAFAALPDRWQQVLQWRAVEGLPRAETARRLGITSNSVSVLGRRAVEGLRVAWLAQWLPTPPGGIEHVRVFEALPRYVRDSLPRERAALLRSHLRGCAQCRAAERQLLSANRRLGGGIFGVLFLGGAGGALTAALRAADPVAPAAFAAAGGATAVHGAVALRPLAVLSSWGGLRLGLGKLAAGIGGKVAVGSTGLVLGATLSAAAIAGTVVLVHPFEPAKPVTVEAGSGWDTDRHTSPSADRPATSETPAPASKRSSRPPAAAGVEPGVGLGRAADAEGGSDPRTLVESILPQREPILPEAPLTPKPGSGAGDSGTPVPPPVRPETPRPLPAPAVHSSGDANGTIAPRLSGTAERGAKISISVAGGRITPAVASDGRWSADLSTTDLPAGQLRAAITQSRDESASPATTVAFSLTVPKIQLTALPTRALDSIRFAAALSISGGVPGATVCVSGPLTTSTRVQLDSRGSSERGLVLYPSGVKALVFAYCDGERFGVRQSIATPGQPEAVLPGEPASPEPADAGPGADAQDAVTAPNTAETPREN